MKFGNGAARRFGAGLAMFALASAAVLSLAGTACAQTQPQPAADPAAAALAQWQRGLALVQDNRPRAAIPLLEGIARVAPDNAAVRAELGLAHARALNDARARSELLTARELATDPRQRQLIERVLAQIDARSPVSGSLNLGLIPETNVNRRSTLETVTLGGLDFVLDDTVRSGTGLSFDARGDLAPMIARDLRARVAVQFAGRLFETRALNDYGLRVSAGLEHLGDRGLVLGAGVLAEQRWAGDARFATERGVYATAEGMIRPTVLAFGRAEIAERRVPSLPRRDATLRRLSVGVTTQLRPQTRVTLRAFLTETRAAADFESGLFSGLGVTVAHAFASGWQMQAQAVLGQDRRSGPERAFGVVRRDEVMRASFSVTNRTVQFRGFSPVFEVGTERRRSSIAIYDFRNTFAGLSVTRGF